METTTTTAIVEQQQQPTGATIPTFEGELYLRFPSSEIDGEVMFKPQALLRTTENPWQYPFPVFNQDEATLSELVTTFGEDFIKLLFLDSLTDLCQSKWKQATAAEDCNTNDARIARFKEVFFERRISTGVTPQKLLEAAQTKLRESKKTTNKEEQATLLAEYKELTAKGIAMIKEQQVAAAKQQANGKT